MPNEGTSLSLQSVALPRSGADLKGTINHRISQLNAHLDAQTQRGSQ